MDDYAGRLESEQADAKLTRERLTQEIEQLQRKMFAEGRNEADVQRLEEYRAELRPLEFRLKTIENILEKLPAAYKELGQNETLRLHYSLFLESAEGERKLLILTTDVPAGKK